MTGIIHVEVTDSSYQVEVDVKDASLKERIECLDAIANGLEMNDGDIAMLCVLRKLHLLKPSRRPITKEADSADES